MAQGQAAPYRSSVRSPVDGGGLTIHAGRWDAMRGKAPQPVCVAERTMTLAVTMKMACWHSMGCVGPGTP